MEKWNKHVKPPSDVCPERFCFHWGWSSCTCAMKACKRLHPDAKTDWYEPHEVELREHGLPWFYFFPSKELIVEDMRDQYEKESRELWAKP